MGGGAEKTPPDGEPAPRDRQPGRGVLSSTELLVHFYKVSIPGTESRVALEDVIAMRFILRQPSPEWRSDLNITVHTRTTESEYGNRVGKFNFLVKRPIISRSLRIISQEYVLYFYLENRVKYPNLN